LAAPTTTNSARPTTLGIGLEHGALEGVQHVIADADRFRDYLILPWRQDNYFGLESVPRHGSVSEDIPEAIRIRNHVLHAFERAMLEAIPSVVGPS